MSQNKNAGKAAKKEKAGNSGISARGYKIILGVMVVICAAAVVTLVSVLLNNSNDDEHLLDDTPVPRGTVGTGVVVTEDNLQEALDWLSRPLEDATYTTSMNIEWVFERWNTPSLNAFVENYHTNNRTVYFDLWLDATEELLFTSPYIPVGAELDEMRLIKQLPAGVYPSTVTYFLVDDDYNEVANLSVAVTVRILS